MANLFSRIDDLTSTSSLRLNGRSRRLDGCSRHLARDCRQSTLRFGQELGEVIADVPDDGLPGRLLDGFQERCHLPLDSGTDRPVGTVPGELEVDRWWKCIGVERDGTHLVGPPKSDAVRRVLNLPTSLIADLRHHLDAFAQPGDDGYVFTGQKGGPLAPHVWQAAWDKARTEVGIPAIHLHDLRHLAGTLAAGTGASTKEVMYHLGHATHQAALRYQHATRQRERAIADALDRLLDGNASGDRAEAAAE